MLNETHGGKFQITSYPSEVGYKDHTDCMVDSNEERDRYATFLVYLNDLGADGGGETLFPELGVDVKPREARALTWTNMNYATGKCEAKSTHRAAKVNHPVKKKYIIQRWYYLKSFYSLGKRVKEPELPTRGPNTPKVSCDQYDFGSCRMYDEWGPDHLIEYMKSKKEF
jgi:prolyl 4-hydroxylase